MSTLYQSDCMPANSVIYGVGATVDANGKVVDSGRVNGTFIMELKNWASIKLSTMVFAIIAQELVRCTLPILLVSCGSID